ncbi:hypothetical protein [Amycolatopsis sp. WGS_07]|uniref:hypothetical protein n=1 Tax=Amycolatopsis sp. WGS_07 TaxID=3076764 RepID=UPI0038737776
MTARLSISELTVADDLLETRSATEMAAWVADHRSAPLDLADLSDGQWAYLARETGKALSLDVLDWLGEDYGGLTVRQIQRLADEFAAIYEQYCTPQHEDQDRTELEQDTEDIREDLYIVAYRLMAENPSEVVAELGKNFNRSRAAADRDRILLRAAARQMVTDPDPSNFGITSARGFARTANVSRTSVIGWTKK